MAYNKEIIKSNIEDITKKSFEEAIYLSYKDGITSLAPLGFSGDTIMLFGEESPKRKSVVSIRNYCNDAELLITDVVGNFLFYGRFDVNFGVEFLSEQYWTIFNLVKDKIETELENNSDFSKVKMNKDLKVSDGFAMLKAYQDKKLEGIENFNKKNPC